MLPYVIFLSSFTKQANKGNKQGKDIKDSPFMEIICSRNEDGEKNDLKKRGSEEMPGDIPMYKEEKKILAGTDVRDQVCLLLTCTIFWVAPY